MKSNLILLLACCLASSCANITTLPGGEKDKTPPKVLSSFPDSAQTGFYSKTLRITFDEYFTVQNLTKELIVSPPFEKAITSRVKGKTLIIELPEYPKTTTTYQFHFGDAIKDVNEGNILKNYSLVFSTGETIDSGRITGLAINSKTSEPMPRTKVFLYLIPNDSNAFLSPPYYLTLSDSFGKFNLQHLADNKYQAIAVEDKNSNNRLDYDEHIGFLDSTIYTNTHNVRFNMFLHKDDRPLQIQQCAETNRGVFTLSFNRKIASKDVGVIAHPLIQPYTKSNNLPFKLSEKEDQLLVYLSAKDAESKDSLTFNVQIGGDTLVCTSKRKEAKTQEINVSISPTQNAKRSIVLNSTLPILKTDITHFTLFNITDSVAIKPIESVLSDAFHLKLNAALQPGKEYRLVFDTSSIRFFSDVTKTTNDTFFFRTYKITELGSVEIRVVVDSALQHQPSSIRLNLFKGISLGSAEGETKQFTVSSDTIIEVRDLTPGDFYITGYVDDDDNGSWTPGNFTQKRHSERTFIKSEAIVVRANWETNNILYILR